MGQRGPGLRLETGEARARPAGLKQNDRLQATGMLDALRRGARGWLAKLLIFLLVISFIFWGITLGGFGLRDVAHVGDVAITPHAFERVYRDQLGLIGQRLGRALSAQESAALGIPEQALGGLISRAAIDNHARKLGLDISDGELARLIREDSRFAGITGRFDPVRFRQIVEASGFGEAAYLQLLREESRRLQLLSIIPEMAEPPRPFVEAGYLFDNEQRKIAWVRATGADLPPTEAVGDAQLQEFHGENEAAFMIPEKRDVAIVELDPARLVDPQSIPQADVEAFYESAPQRFGAPETRHILQIGFDSREAARKARTRLIGGETDFAGLATEAGLDETDIDLGTVARADLVDPAIGEAAFSLSQGEISQPVTGAFGPVLLAVQQINPAQTRSLDEVGSAIRALLARRDGEARALELYNAIEDARAGGSVLGEIATRFDLPLQTFSGVEREALPEDWPDIDGLRDAVFDAQLEEETDPLAFGRYGFVWFEPLSIAAASPQSFEDARPAVAAAFEEEARYRALASLAGDMVRRLDAGEDFATLAGTLSEPDVNTSQLTRQGTGGDDLDAQFIASAFQVSPGRAGDIELTDGTRIIFQVQESIQPAFFDEAARIGPMSAALGASLSADMERHLVDALTQASDVEINEPLVAALTGLDDAAARR